MSLEVRYLGHSCFLLDDGKYKLLTDPYLSGNDLAAVSADEVSADFILVSHEHHDHVGDSVRIAKNCASEICCPADLKGLFESKHLKVTAGNIGGRVKMPFGAIKYFQAQHGCIACGFVIDFGGRRVYFAGDTALMSDMALLADEGIDLALLPIGDYYTMGPEDALRAVRLIKPRLTVPMHFDTFPRIAQDADTFAESVNKAGFEAKHLRIGESLRI